MRRLTSLLLVLPFLGGGCLPHAPEAAVRLDVSYAFKAGCIAVLARDDQGHEAINQVEVIERGPSKVVIAVFRKEDWSHTMELITTAHEQSCDGHEVARDVHTVKLQKKGGIEQLALTLEAQDADGDGYMAKASGGTDCDDDDEKSRPGLGELCDGRDNDCDGKVDDGFEAKGTACSIPCPGGQFACNASHDGLSCINSPTPTLFYPDVDGDGAGDEDATPVQVCPDVTHPTGIVANKDDCDDQDKHNRRGKAEVCDDRDNNCDSWQDEGEICGGKGWKVVSDGALTGDRQWKTVALGNDGRVWMAGDGGKLAVRLAEGQAFTSLDGDCGNVNWRAAWVSPGNNHVFLAGDGGNLAEHDGSSCKNQVTVASGNALQGIIGFSPMLYVVDNRGRLYAWSPGVSREERYNLNPPTYFDIHGLDSTQLLGVGGTESGSPQPYISKYPGIGNASAVTPHTVSDVLGSYNGSLRGVWMGGSTFAYAVGDGGLVVKWNGDKNWTRVLPPSDSSNAPFTSVVALDPSSIYVTDANSSGAIRRLNATGTWVTAYTSDRPLRDLALNSPENIWAVGDDGRVVHFPE